MNSRHLIGRRLASPLCKWAFSRCYATDGERAIEQILRDRFQAARLIRVADVSGKTKFFTYFVCGKNEQESQN